FREQKQYEKILKNIEDVQRSRSASVLGKEYAHESHLWEWAPYQEPVLEIFSYPLARWIVQRKYGIWRKDIWERIGNARNAWLLGIVASTAYGASLMLPLYSLPVWIQWTAVVSFLIVRMSASGSIFVGAHKNLGGTEKLVLFFTGATLSGVRVLPAILFFNAIGYVLPWHMNLLFYALFALLGITWNIDTHQTFNERKDELREWLLKSLPGTFHPFLPDPFPFASTLGGGPIFNDEEIIAAILKALDEGLGVSITEINQKSQRKNKVGGVLYKAFMDFTRNKNAKRGNFNFWVEIVEEARSRRPNAPRRPAPAVPARQVKSPPSSPANPEWIPMFFNEDALRRLELRFKDGQVLVAGLKFSVLSCKGYPNFVMLITNLRNARVITTRLNDLDYLRFVSAGVKEKMGWFDPRFILDLDMALDFTKPGQEIFTIALLAEARRILKTTDYDKLIELSEVSGRSTPQEEEYRQILKELSKRRGSRKVFAPEESEEGVEDSNLEVPELDDSSLINLPDPDPAEGLVPDEEGESLGERFGGVVPEIEGWWIRQWPQGHYLKNLRFYRFFVAPFLLENALYFLPLILVLASLSPVLAGLAMPVILWILWKYVQSHPPESQFVSAAIATVNSLIIFYLSSIHWAPLQIGIVTGAAHILMNVADYLWKLQRKGSRIHLQKANKGSLQDDLQSIGRWIGDEVPQSPALNTPRAIVVAYENLSAFKETIRFLAAQDGNNRGCELFVACDPGISAAQIRSDLKSSGITEKEIPYKIRTLTKDRGLYPLRTLLHLEGLSFGYAIVLLVDADRMIWSWKDVSKKVREFAFKNVPSQPLQSLRLDERVLTLLLQSQ
ncbi:MAG: hypothetical protein HYS58_00245, partial [Elusimicrobia bacterium]|nr:hypothetical protein [Elusimicrobiota bacterium]